MTLPITAWPVARTEDPPSAAIRSNATTNRAAELLLRAVGASPGASPTPVRELVALGSLATPFLVEVLERGGVPIGSDGTHVVSIPAELEESILAALARLPRAPAVALLRESCASSDLRERETALRVLGRIGTREDLDLLASLATPIGSDGLVAPAIRRAFEDALVLVMERDPKAFVQVSGLYARVPPALVFPVVRAIERHPSVRAIDALASFLGVRPEADLLLLTELARTADAVGLPPPPAVTQKTRRYLTERVDTRCLGAAIAAAGALEDYDAVPSLAELLGHSDGDVARGARSGLRRIARKDLGKRPQAWLSWFEAESEWWKSKSESAAQDVRGPDLARAVSAVLDLGRRRVRRHDAALLLAEGLVRPEPDIARLCCQALGHLRSPLSVPALEAAKDHADAAVRAAADEALARIHEGSVSGETVGASHRAEAR